MRIRKNTNHNFTLVDNAILKEGMSLAALGLYFYLISKPDNWNFSIKGSSAQLANGVESIRTAIKELEEHGFLSRSQSRLSGKFGTGVWVIFDQPLCGFTTSVATTSWNSLQVNTKEVNTKEDIPIVPFQSEELSNGTTSSPRSAPPSSPNQGFEELNQFISGVNQMTHSHFKPTHALLPNFNYWLRDYTVEEMLKAYYNARFDSWWKDKITPTKFLRRKNTNQEAANYIDDLLNSKHPEAAR